MMNVRVDDFPGTKPDEFWKHNLENFKRFDSVMEKHGVTYVLGVIPKWTSPADVEYLASNPRIEIALHGVNHDERFQNEFRDHETENDIYQAIVKAQTFLGGSGVTTYIPPHNVIDRKTVNALKRAGFTRIFGGPETDPNVLEFAKGKGIVVQSHMPPFHYGRSDELLAHGSPVALSIDPSLGLHWTWELNIGLENLDKFFTEIKRCRTQK